jgi:hypothetical protein
MQPTRTAAWSQARHPCGWHAVPIRFCSRRGLPCQPRRRGRGALLPHLFTLTGADAGGMSLWRCPWGRPRRPLAAAVSPWSPDFPPGFPPAAAQPTDRRCVGAARPAGQGKAVGDGKNADWYADWYADMPLGPPALPDADKTGLGLRGCGRSPGCPLKSFLRRGGRRSGLVSGAAGHDAPATMTAPVPLARRGRDGVPDSAAVASRPLPEHRKTLRE